MKKSLFEVIVDVVIELGVLVMGASLLWAFLTEIAEMSGLLAIVLFIIIVTFLIKKGVILPKKH
ncbi:hypothetical protein COJ21_09795 [Priestia megaterium]|uniref:hypothetical protein n=1 Tax=Priestia megaterium TaxID=1404 RepID=UPI000BF31206|nr:hypothetical protein [Priestia megaterium]PFK77404.1 hypothetical protein COJ21_09795 [Priestia megaterium]